MEDMYERDSNQYLHLRRRFAAGFQISSENQNRAEDELLVGDCVHEGLGEDCAALARI